jgi:hypothetical protein
MIFPLKPPFIRDFPWLLNNLRGGTRKVGEQERNRRKNEGERAREKT